MPSRSGACWKIQRKVFATIALFLIPIGLTCTAWPSPASEIQQARPELVDLEKRIEAGLSSFEELRFIRSYAEKHHRRVYVFGGTATTIASFILRTEPLADDPNPWSFGTIFRDTQDFDIIYDGSAQEAIEFELELNDRFPFVHRREPLDPIPTSSWEVRPLRQRIGPKPHLIDENGKVEIGFRSQNTDTLSTGLIEITDPPSEQQRIIDLRFLDKKIDLAQLDPEATPNFLGDLYRHKVTFIRSPKHQSTEMAKRGRNPEILGLLRALTKAAQTGFDFDLRQIDQIEAILDDFQPTRDLRDPTAKLRVIQQARKLIASSEDRFWLYETLENIQDKKGVSLRKHLIQLDLSTGPWSLSLLLEKAPEAISILPPPSVTPEAVSISSFTACMEIFTENSSSVISILGISDPRLRVEKIKQMDWKTLHPQDQQIVLAHAPEALNSYEISAFIDIAAYSVDQRWEVVLKGWIKSFQPYHRGWQAILYHQAEQALKTLRSSTRSSRIKKNL